MKSFNHKYVPSGAFFLASELSHEGYDVDLHEIDAKLIRHFDWFENQIGNCNALFYQQAFLEHLSGINRDPWLDGLIEQVTEGMSGYDYILISNSRNPTFEIPVRAGNYFTILLFEKLSKMNPGAERISGGLRNQYLNADEFANYGIDMKNFVDLIVIGKIPFSSIAGILEEKVVIGSSFFDFTGKYRQIPMPKEMADPPMDYPLPQKVLRNAEDLTHSYERIFSDLMLEIPDASKKNQYIKQMEIHYIGGCISKCAFCSTGMANLRLSNEEHFFETMRILIYEHGFNSFFFENATLNSHKKLVEKFCNWIVRNNLKIYWSDSCRLSKNGADFYKMLYSAGCRQLCFGVDSGSNRMLEMIQKGSTAEEMQRELEYSHNAGIWNLANFIVGLPHEQLEDLDMTLKWLEDNHQFVNIFKYNVFHLEHHSPYYATPQKFNLHIPEKDLPPQTGGREGIALDECEFSEIGGRSYKEFCDYRKYTKSQFKRWEPIREQGFKTHIGQPLLFALYDMLGDKKSVEEWLFQNFRKARKAYYKKTEAMPKIESWGSAYLLQDYFPADSYKPLFPSLVFKHIDSKTPEHKQV